MSNIFKRSIVRSTRGVVTSGHYLASSAGLGILAGGGNAVDAAAAMAFCLHLLEPHQNGIGGEVPTLVYSAREAKVFAISGMGFSPAGFTIEFCRNNGIDMIPGDGYLPACVPAAVGTWALALARFGTMSFAQVLAPAIELGERGFPMHPALQASIEGSCRRFAERYPTTAAIYLPGGKVPRIGEVFRNGDFAETLRTICRAEAAATGGRVAGIEAGRDAFYKGQIAERIVGFINDNPVADDSGTAHRGLLTLDDLSAWSAEAEEPLTLNYRGLDVHKCSSWTQGPVFLQQLSLLGGFDLAGMGHNSADYLHTWIECAKLAFADREGYYGDPKFDNPPFDVLLSDQYARRRRELVGQKASLELRPGDAGRGIPKYATFDVLADNRRALGLSAGEAAEPVGPSDTTQLDAADAEGNFVAATPSGGWISTSPVIEGLGFPLGTRGQMFYLNPSRPNALAGRKRPRCTLTPTIVTRGPRGHMGFGMRGGDGQDQWTNQFFVNHVDFAMDIQDALDAPVVLIEHMPSSFYPRKAHPGRVLVDKRIAPDVIRDLRNRGHDVVLADNDTLNMMCVRRNDRGTLEAAIRSTGRPGQAMAW